MAEANRYESKGELQNTDTKAETKDAHREARAAFSSALAKRATRAMVAATKATANETRDSRMDEVGED